MWLDLVKAALAIVCMFVAARLLRARLAEMEPAEAARAKRNIWLGMLAAAAFTGALTVYFPSLSPP